MNNKVTFEELIEAIASQSGKPKQFTRDFIKDFVALINESLEKDGKINIAGLGKFELRKMDERGGYNPQTEEKITIPAHNKIVFKPYKDLRELVNTPYAHLEPEIIKEGRDEEHSSEEIKDQEQKDKQDAAPTPVDSEEGTAQKKVPRQEDMESEPDIDEDDPLGLDTGRKSSDSFSFQDEDDEDIVEFTSANVPEAEEETGDKDATDAEEQSTEEKSTDESFTEREPQSGDDSEETLSPVKETEDESDIPENKEEKETTVTPPAEEDNHPQYPVPIVTRSIRNRRHRKQRSKGSFWIIAAAFIILFIAIGAWYFMGYQQDTLPDSMTTQSVQNQQSPDNKQPIPPDTEPRQNQNANKPSAAGKQQAAGNRQHAGVGTGQQESRPANTPIKTITVAEGHTLWGLADNQYDNPYLWPWIYDTNKPRIDDPDILIIGQLLHIPLRRGSNNQLSSNDSLQVALGYIETYRWYKENNLENARFYLYAAKKYQSRVFEYTDAEIDDADLAFANRAQ